MTVDIPPCSWWTVEAYYLYREDRMASVRYMLNNYWNIITMRFFRRYYYILFMLCAFFFSFSLTILENHFKISWMVAILYYVEIRSYYYENSLTLIFPPNPHLIASLFSQLNFGPLINWPSI
jgi:hypothetical protein